MPNHVDIPFLQTVSPADEPYKAVSEVIDSTYALSLVNLTFGQFETFRNQHDRRWNAHDGLWLGWLPQKVWEGTTVPRSNLGIPLTFDQVESALPAISQALFSNPDWFQVEPEPGTESQEARDVQDAIQYVLDHPKDDVGTNGISELELAIINLLIYGNGGIAVDYDPVLQRPTISWVDIRDIYVDPGLSVPSLDESRAVIRRKWYTVQELDDLRQDDRFKLPTTDQLWTMAQNFQNRPADQTKRVQETLRGVYYSPGSSDYLPSPSEQKVEVLIYYTKNRLIWVLNQQWVAFNQPNPYGCQPFCFAPCYIVPGRFYAMGIADVQESNQRYIEALMNGRLDQVTMDLQPPRVGRRGSLMTPAQTKWRPGAYYQAEEAKDMALLQPQTSLTNIYTEIQYIDSLADRRTGITSLSGGVPKPSNANRTSGGMQMQLAGGNTRISHIVGNIEKYLIVPMLYKLQRIMQFHTSQDQQVSAMGNNRDQRQVPGSIIQKKVRFKMLSASRMITREKLMQIVPFLEQTLLQGQLVQELHGIGKTVDFEVVAQMVQDAAGIGEMYKLVRPMTDEEKKSQRERSQQQTNPMLQKAQMDGQIRNQLMDKKVQGKLQEIQLQKTPSQAEMQAQQQQAMLDQQVQQAELQQAQQEAQVKQAHEMMMAHIKQEAEKQKHQLEIAKHHSSLAMQQQQNQMDMQTGAATHQMKMAQIMQQLQVQRAQAEEQQNIANDFPKSQAGASGAETPKGKPERTDRSPRQTASAKPKPKAPQ